MHPYLDVEGPIAFAHRGGDIDGLENSMRAIADAVTLGYRYVETDVRVSRDGVLVTFHDRTLERMTGHRGQVADLTWSELSRLRILGREPIPRLDDVLSTWPDLRLNLDVKTDRAVRPLLELLRREGVTDRVCVGSFSHGRLRTLRAGFGHELCSSASPAEVARVRTGWRPARRRRPPFHCLQVPVRRGPMTVVEPRTLARCHDAGLPVHVWTINDRTAMVTLLELGVDGIMSDATRVLRDVLAERGQWPT